MKVSGYAALGASESKLGTIKGAEKGARASFNTGQSPVFRVRRESYSSPCRRSRMIRSHVDTEDSDRRDDTRDPGTDLTVSFLGAKRGPQDRIHQRGVVVTVCSTLFSSTGERILLHTYQSSLVSIYCRQFTNDDAAV